MNIINKGFLKLALLPSPIYKKLGVDQRALSAILHVKLTMDDRRLSALQQTRQRKSDKQVSSATIFTMVISAVFGLLYLIAFYFGRTIVTGMTFYFFMFFFMLSATLISDFTSVLIDVRDTFIILPKPVNDRTVLMARLLHIFIHICKMVLPMAIPGIIYIGIQYGPLSSLWMLAMIFLLTLLAIFFINAVYIVILRITTPQKFQNVISYFQIVFAIVIYASYQILPRMMETSGMADFDITERSWAAFLPMYWMAVGWESLTNFQFSNLSVIYTVAGVLLPLVCSWVVVRFLAPSFNNKLALINSTADNVSTAKKTTTIQKRSLADKIGKAITTTGAEAAGFSFAWKMSGRSRDFRLKVYPSIGYLVVLVVIFFMRAKNFSFSNLQTDADQFRFLLIAAIYFMSLLLITALSQMVYSEKYKASWIFYSAPVAYPGDVILGAVKAIVLKFYIPIVVLLTIPGVIIGGPAILPNVLLGLFNQLLISTLLVYINYRHLPFSRKQNNNNSGGSFVRNLGVMLISGVIAVMHYMIFKMTVVVWICAALSIIATWLMTGSIRKTAWEKIRMDKED
jgi:ABC-2 type transport system permease protein